MDDAQELLKKRRAETKAARDEKIAESVEKSERRGSGLDTGKNYKFAARDPGSGRVTVRGGSGSVTGYPVSNADLSASSIVQILDSGNNTPHINFAPSPRPRRPEPPAAPSSPSTIGAISVLFDTLVNGEAVSSCNTLNDVWALYAIIQYVKPARCMVLFSFPVESTPTSYACPRYRFGMHEGGVWSCIPTNDPDAPYATSAECQKDNPVTCAGMEETWGIEPGYPIKGVPVPGAEQWTRFVSACDPTYIWDWDALVDGLKDITYDIYRGNIFFQGTDIRYNTWGVIERGKRLPKNPLYSPGNKSGSYTAPAALAAFRRQTGREYPKCGDTISVTVPYGTQIFGAKCYIYDRVLQTSTTISKESDFLNISGYRSAYFTWQPEGTIHSPYWGWRSGRGTTVCTRTTEDRPDGSRIIDKTPPPPTDFIPECQPPIAPFSNIKRQFWVGGHVDTPIKLAEINEEDLYEFYGTLTSDGYVVTLKTGRSKVNGVEQWCKVQTFSTTNLKDWRTEEYTTSKALNPSLPSGLPGTLISTKNNRANISTDGTHDVNPQQLLTGLGGIERTLAQEILTRPDPQDPSATTSILCDCIFTPNGGSPQTVPTLIHRIVDTIPDNLNEIVGGCVSVKDVEIQYSPLFLPNS